MLLGDDPRVKFQVGRTGYLVSQFYEKTHASDHIEAAGLLEGFMDGEDIDRLGALEEVHHRFEDDPMRFLVEAIRGQDIEYHGHCILVEHQRTEYNFLYLSGLWLEFAIDQVREVIVRADRFQPAAGGLGIILIGLSHLSVSCELSVVNVACPERG